MKSLNFIWQNKFFKNSFIIITGNILAGFLGYLFHLLISRKLSIASYGELQTLTSLLNILAVPTIAINFFIIKYSSAFYEKKDHGSNYKFYQWLSKNIFILALLVSAVFILIAPLIKNYLRLNEYLGLWIIIIIMAFSLLQTAAKGLLNGWHNFKSLSVNNISGAVIKLLGGLILVSILPITASALLGILAGVLFSYIYLTIIFKKNSRPTKETIAESTKDDQLIDKNNFTKEIKKYILPIFFFSLFLSLLTSFDMLMVKNLTSPELAGFYGAFNILSKIIFWACSSVVIVVLPMACAKNSVNKQLHKNILIYANTLIILIGVTGFLAYFFFPDLIINLLFGSRYLPFAGSLWAFALMAIALSLLNLEATLAYSRYDFKISYILLITLILEIIFVYILGQSLLHIALIIASIQFLGYLASLFYNQKAIKKCQLTNLGEINP